MSIDEFVKIVEALTKLTGVLIWPVILVFLLVKFSPSLKNFFYNLGELSVKGGGFEATAKIKQAEASTALVAASVAKPDATATPESAIRHARDAAAAVADNVNARVIRRASSAIVLWVDDRPNNNVFERQSMEALGISFVLATSTDEAMKLIASRHFDVIISDMGRPPDTNAGFTLLEKIRKSDNKTPFIIYAGARANALRSEALSRGATESTNLASELFKCVISVLNDKH